MIELTKEEKQVLSIMFTMFSDFMYLLNNNSCYIEDLNHIGLDNNSLFDIAEKLGVDY